MPALKVGYIYRHAALYRDPLTGNLMPKYLVALACAPGGDIVARLLTSKATGRSISPTCSHRAPYPGYFLGVLGGPLSANSWVDLRVLDDLDDGDAQSLLRKGIVSETMPLPPEHTRPLLECLVGAPDTRTGQARAIRDQLARLA